MLSRFTARWLSSSYDPNFATVRKALTVTPPATPFRERVDVSADEHEELLKTAPLRAFFEPFAAQRELVGFPKQIPYGRPWFARELRMKSFEDLHKLHFSLLQERNKLLSEKVRRRNLGLVLPSPERWQNVRHSMARLQTVMAERAKEDRLLREKKYLSEPKPEKSAQRVEWERKRALVEEQMPNRRPHVGFGVGAGGAKTRLRVKQAVDMEDVLVLSTSVSSEERKPVAFNKMPKQVQEVLGDRTKPDLVRTQQDRMVRVTRHQEFVQRTKPQHQEKPREEQQWVKAIRTGVKTKPKPHPDRWPREGDW